VHVTAVRLVSFVVIWYIFPRFGMLYKEDLATLQPCPKLLRAPSTVNLALCSFLICTALTPAKWLHFVISNITYIGTTIQATTKSTYPCTKVRTQVRKFIPRYESSYPGTKVRTQVRKYVPRYESTYPGTKVRTQVRKYVPRYESSYPGTKYHTQVRNITPRCKFC
jgi:hypothetical protein